MKIIPFYYLHVKITNMNYWIFQCNPSAYAYSEAINTDLLKQWNVKQYKKEIKKGDKAIIWFTGQNSPGCYALVDITSDPQPGAGLSEDNILFNENDVTGRRLKEEDLTGDRVSIEVTHNLLANPILKATVQNTIGLENFRAGKQGSFGTNLISSKQEYEAILRMIV